MKSLIDISDINLPKELTDIIYMYAKKKDRTYKTDHAKLINGLVFVKSRNKLFCISKTRAPLILFPKYIRESSIKIKLCN
jgi:hypothetical protein